MIQVPNWAKPHICTSYPQSNHLPFEEWLTQQELPQFEREFIPIHITSYWVNNNYGNDIYAKQKMQEFFNELDKSKKYWCVFQYDDGLLIDTKDLDIITFGMSWRLESQKPTYVIPLIGQPYKKIHAQKKYKANFIGNMTHPIRNEIINTLRNKEGYYISAASHNVDEFNRIMAESIFTLAPRGYGTPSFRAYEAMYQGSIPVYISDEFAIPLNTNFNDYGVLIKSENIALIDEILNSYNEYNIKMKREAIADFYSKYCTYEGLKERIIETLQNENANHS